MEKKFDVVALGELLIDFTEYGKSNQDNKLVEANPGGAPCNVLAMLSKLQHKTAFIGKVGNDMFGKTLKDILEEQKIDSTNLVLDARYPTTLAFISKNKKGDREFSFYRNPGADMMLFPSDIKKEVICAARLFHFGSLSMTHEDNFKATQKAVEIAKREGLMLSFDPNLRELLWDNLDLAKQRIQYGIECCDILKISDNEIQWFMDETDIKVAARKLLQRYPIKMLLLSMGQNGSCAYYKNIVVEVPAFLQETTVETTGAGDTFFGSCLHFILQYGLEELNQSQIFEMLQFANAAASIITTKKGALRVMPEEYEVKHLIQNSKKC